MAAAGPDDFVTQQLHAEMSKPKPNWEEVNRLIGILYEAMTAMLIFKTVMGRLTELVKKWLEANLASEWVKEDPVYVEHYNQLLANLNAGKLEIFFYYDQSTRKIGVSIKFPYADALSKKYRGNSRPLFEFPEIMERELLAINEILSPDDFAFTGDLEAVKIIWICCLSAD